MESYASKVEGDFPVYFRYTVGLAAEKFFREIKENGKLLASRCPKCDLNYLPPRIYCERCMTKLDEHVEVENTGTVETYTICRRDGHGNDLAEPFTVALVRFPNTQGGLVHRVKGKISIGDLVRVVFEDRARRTGSILDIECFEKMI